MDSFDDLYRNAYPTIDRTEDDIGAGHASGEVDDPAASEAPRAPHTPETKRNSKSGRRTQEIPKRGLTEEQIQKLVTADSISDLVSLLERA